MTAADELLLEIAASVPESAAKSAILVSMDGKAAVYAFKQYKFLA